MTAFTGTWVMVRLILRRDRIRLPVWVLALVGLVWFSASAVQGIYNTPAERASYAETVGSNTATVAMSGPAIALHTTGGITVYETSITLIIGTALMAIFLVVRHTRADEEAGRTELLRAGVLGRHAPTLATGLVVGAASALVGLGTAACFVASGLALESSLLFGASIAAIGWVFTGVALVTAQVSEHGRGATGLGLAVLGAAYVIRAIGDVADNWVSFLSPVGWTQQVSAFGDERWWPLGLSAAAALLLAGLAGWLTTRRDFGAGLVAPRPGPTRAGPRLAGALGLASRLQRASLISWTVAMALLGMAYGSFGNAVEDLLDSNPDLADAIARTSGASIVDAYYATTLMISALIATGFTLSSALRLRSEEAADRAEPLLATPMSRVRWATGSLAVTAAGSLLLLAVTGLGTGLVHAAVSGDTAEGGRLVVDVFAFLPAMLVMAGLAFALIGWVPRLAASVWAALALFVLIGWLGELLSFPAWLEDLSPYAQTPQVPMVELAWGPLVVLCLIAVGLYAVGLVGLRRRDIG